MNRIIKFRGKRLGDSHWIYGYLAGENYINNIDEVAIPCEEIAPSTLGEFIGLTDCNGREIYEGDIITVKGLYPRVVLWDKICWALMPTEYYHDKVFWVMNLQHPGTDWWDEFSDEFEIIGNLHDNPELLKTE